MSTIQPIKNDQAVAQIVSRQTTPAQSQPQKALSGIDDKLGSPDRSDKTDKTDKTSAVTNRLSALQSGKESSEIHILAVRTSKAVEEQLESAQQKMNEITNSYPPFLRGSEQRQQYLMSISSIRKQIEAMTIPPIKADQLDASSGNKAKQMWASLFEKLDMPALEVNGPNEASDAQIRVASSAFGTMRSELSARRAVLEQQVAPTGPVSSPMAQYMSQSAGQGLAQTGFSLTTNLIGALKGL